MSTAFKDRFSLALETAQKTYTDLAADLGDVTRSAVGHWASGRRTPDNGDIARIAELLGVRAAWLAFGEEPMTATSPVDGPRVVRDPDFSQLPSTESP